MEFYEHKQSLDTQKSTAENKSFEDKELKYKGFTGSVEFSIEDNIYFGQVKNAGQGIFISYEGETLEALEIDFKQAVDYYLN